MSNLDTSISSVELLSIEVGFVWIVSAFAGINGICFIAEGVLVNYKNVQSKFSKINNWFDRVSLSFYEYSSAIPWLIFAGAIAVVAPIYELYLDGPWLSGYADGKVDFDQNEIRDFIVNGDDGKIIRDLIHSIQMASFLIILWVYSLIWEKLHTYIENRFSNEREANFSIGAAFSLFCGGCLYFTGWLSSIGANPERVVNWITHSMLQ